MCSAWRKHFLSLMLFHKLCITLCFSNLQAVPQGVWAQSSVLCPPYRFPLLSRGGNKSITQHQMLLSPISAFHWATCSLERQLASWNSVNYLHLLQPLLFFHVIIESFQHKRKTSGRAPTREEHPSGSSCPTPTCPGHHLISAKLQVQTLHTLFMDYCRILLLMSVLEKMHFSQNIFRNRFHKG